MKTIYITILIIAVSTLAQATPVPDGFENQTLDITYGRITKPKEWFYSYFTDERSIVWTISKENAKIGEFYTGMRIQFTPRFSQVANKAPDKFVNQYITSKKQSAVILSECPPKQAGEFTRICLETKENMKTVHGSREFRIMYSLFWSNEADMFIVTTFGAPSAEWETVRPILDIMSEFELLGEKFWKEIKKTPEQTARPDGE